jgi:hypothetical protein
MFLQHSHLRFICALENRTNRNLDGGHDEIVHNPHACFGRVRISGRVQRTDTIAVADGISRADERDRRANRPG